MGNCDGKQRKGGGGLSAGFRAISDKFTTLEQVQNALRSNGLESSNLIIGVDFTKSNTWTGKATFGGKCLHDLTPGQTNPYESAISTVARVLEPFDDDHLIPAYGFGDVTTTDKGVFAFFPEERPCNGLVEVLQRYREIVPHVQLSGPTSFAPLVRKAVEIVERTRQYHILVIVADGQVTDLQETASAIIEASKRALSIVLVGVGDGPWDSMREFDDALTARRFDNFQFVNFYQTMTAPRVENHEVAFAVAALQEIPDQWKAIKQLRLLP